MLSKLLSRPRLSALVLRRGMSETAHKGHEPNPELWEKIFYFVACPAIVLSMLNTYLAEVEHAKHHKRPEFKPYEHMRIRTRKFPWGDGDHTLFHNPKINALSTGYETDEEGNFIR
ncbi:Cytochrome c oxidase subunit 6A1, mitochondrial [Halotydeus destructor]|nr:Cytochrome c oxidase subunit 6A1, mitochondrial [Halotydeus destructor]